jgi:proton-dependent oligopeptide transporter, POT family
MSETPKGHPKGLYVLFVTEMWERFSYYGMRAIFVLFLTKALLYDRAMAADGFYGSYTGLVYLTPLIGGYVADRFWGNRRSIIMGGMLMALGQFLMFLSGSFFETIELARPLMLGGLFFLILGNGFFKPNISTMVGQLYPKGDSRVDSAFTIFYMGINLGAFFSPLVCGGLGDTGDPADFKWGFLAACIGMLISLLLFIMLKDKYIVTPDGQPIGAAPNKSRETVDVDTPKEAGETFTGKQVGLWAGIAAALFSLFFFVFDTDLIGSFIFSLSIAAPGLIISDKSLKKIEKQRIWVIYIVAFFVIFFWAAFEQAGASLTFFADEQTDRYIGTYQVPASYFQSINAVAIVLLAPIFVMIWAGLSRRGKEPASPYKQAIGLVLLALGYVVIAFGVKTLAPGEKASMMLLFSLYFIHTLGELCLSPIGLSMVNKLAPVKFASLLMGVWFLSTAAANKFAGMLSALYPEDVKSDYVLVADNFEQILVPAHDTVPAQIAKIKNDSAFIVNNFQEAPEFIAANFEAKERAPGDTVMVLKSGIATWELDTASFKDEADKGKMKVRLNKIKNIYVANKFEVPLFQLKQIFRIAEVKGKGETAEEQTKIDKFWIDGKDERCARYSFTSDGSRVAVWKNGEIKLWNLSPEKPSFLGMKITGLYEFFMIFVVLAGIASVILFFLAGKLVKMMNGVR